MKKLYFKNPVFGEGVEITVRLGLKWAGSHLYDVKLTDTETGENFGRAEIRGVLSLPFGRIPAQLLVLEHDPVCRHKGGLRRELERVYERPVPDKQMVTILFFERSS